MTAPTTTTTDVAKEQAAQVGQAAAGSGAEVAGTAKEQAGQVIGESIDQAKDLAGTVASTVQDQLRAQSGKVGEHLSKISSQLTEGDTSGVVGQVMTEAGQRLRGLAEHLERTGPEGLLEDVRRYARRSPGSFLLGAAAAGVVAGRLTKGLKASSSSPATPAAPVPSTPVSALDDPYPPTTVLGGVAPGGIQ